MKKLFMVFCIVVMFFGVVGCPSNDDPATTFSTSSLTSQPVAATPETGTSEPLGASPVPECTTLVLLGSGLVGLVGLGRKKSKK
ncbi:MAG: PEP-CTERM sorting domain-containing protein [Deltaproteobacteria bacterium]|nr:PEP-CTERM sorting domain-containing protein [Deltaproteobacteria bacterium]